MTGSLVRTLVVPSVFEVLQIDSVLIHGVEASSDALQWVGNVTYQLTVVGVGF